MHSATKILMGMTRSSYRHAEPKKGSIAAGVLVRLKSDDTIVTTKADGSAMGISLGKDLSNIGFTSIVKAGTAVPVALTAAFTPVVGAQVFISDTTGLAIASGAGATGINAYYTTGPLTRVNEDGTETANGAALIDMPGGV